MALNLALKIAARRAARRAYIAKHEDQKLSSFVAEFENDFRMESLDPATIFLLVKMAIELWLWWKNRGETTPDTAPLPGEPVSYSEDNDAD